MKRFPAQQILEGQGFLVFGADPGLIFPGKILDHLVGCYGDVPGPLAVIGPATREDWLRQRDVYSPELNDTWPHDTEFYKAVAE
jgi:hypothetical protein